MLNVGNSEGVQLQSKLFRGFGDPARLNILQVLRNGPMTVSEIVAATCMSQSNTSNHLRCLRECGLVLLNNKASLPCIASATTAWAIYWPWADPCWPMLPAVYECTRYSSPQDISAGQKIK